MDALNAASLTPLSVLSDRKTEPRKTPSNPTLSSPKVLNFCTFIKSPSLLQHCLSRNFHGSLALLSSVLSSSYAKALTYEEALQQSVSSPTPTPSFDFDLSSAIDGAVSFATENPVVVAGGAAILALPLVLSQVSGKPKPFGVESAKSAYSKLGGDAGAQLLDIRPTKELREVGTPDVRNLGKKPVSVVYRGEDKNGFLKKLALKFKKPENTTLFILDKFDGNSELVAELVTVNGFKAAYAIKDGAEGPRGWMNSGLPWTAPKKVMSLDLSNLTESISGAFGGEFEALPVTLGIAAATGVGLLAFTEVETILQLLGSAALIQLFSKKLLFAEDRKKTLKDVDEFLNTKVGPKELVDELKDIGKAFLPSPFTNKALPVSSPDYSTALKAQAVPEPKVEAAAQPAPQINSVPKAEVNTSGFSGFSRPLSPYPSYPDFKPPTSPTPSQP